MVYHPQTMKHKETADAVEEAIRELRYGTVCINSAFNGLSFAFATPPWGYPGSSVSDIHRGSGWEHNTYMLQGIEKTVARFPITSFPKPVYFPSHRTADKVLKNLVALEEKSSWMKVPAVVFAAMRS